MSAGGPQLDYDVHGLAGIRVVDATPKDAAVVARQLGPMPSALARAPDIVIRFVDRLPSASRVRYLGVDDAGFTDDAFLVLRGKHKSRARVQIPFDRIGKERCEIVCERGLSQVPLLTAILNLTILGKGTALPLHASAFTYRETGFVATGWAKSGKTETLLGFMANGASYVADEWVYLRADGLRMHGLAEPIKVWGWHLDSVPRFKKVLRLRARAKLRLLKSMVGGMDRLASPNGGTAGRLRALLDRQLYVEVPPHTLFGEEACTLEGVPKKVLFLRTHEASDVTVRPVDPGEVVRRMVFSLQAEQMALNDYYWKHRFAFPDAANELVERSHGLQLEMLERVLRGKETYEVHLPFPVSIPSLFEAIEKRCFGSPAPLRPEGVEARADAGAGAGTGT